MANIEKVQLESFEFVQKAISLREDNAKLKKQNRRIKREMKHLQHELEELRSRSQSQQWSLPISCVESIQSNHGVYYDEQGNSMNLSELKMIIEDKYTELDDIQTNITKSTQVSMNSMHERLNHCMEKIKHFQSKQIRSKQQEKDTME